MGDDERAKHPSTLLNLDGTQGRRDSEEAIARYNRTARKNADLVILNILNNLTQSVRDGHISTTNQDRTLTTKSNYANTSVVQTSMLKTIISMDEEEIYGAEIDESNDCEAIKV